MISSFFLDPDRLALGTREVPTSHTPIELPWGMAHPDRRNHLYVIGKTGMGKTALLRNILLQDIARGAGVALIDAHGDLAEELLEHIPTHRTNDVVYFNPADLDYPIAWNPVQTIPKDERPVMADFLVDGLKSIFGDSWGPRLEWILSNAVRVCQDVEQATLVSAYRMLEDESYRTALVHQAEHPAARAFWQTTFPAWPSHYRLEAIGAVQNKLSRFLGSPATRNIVGQYKGKIDLGFVMEHHRIFIANLAKGMLGPDQANLLGSLLVAQFQAAAFRRATIPEAARTDFYLVIDEFHNFMTDSFASILSEARKYRLNLTLAHQYLDQALPAVRQAILGNVGSLIAFRVGGEDGALLERAFANDRYLKQVHLIALKKYEVIASIQQEGLPGVSFQGKTLAPLAYDTGQRDVIIALSRERYCRPRAQVEPSINAMFVDAQHGKSPPEYGGRARRNSAGTPLDPGG
jgi:hypothetical protein